MYDYAGNRKRRDARIEIGMPEHEADLLSLFEADVASKEETLREALTSMADRVEYTLERLDKGGTLNSLGEIQGAGSEVDVKVAAVCVAREKLAQALRLLAPGEVSK
jgi:hypothetical protein